jgi:hypothetical protein
MSGDDAFDGVVETAFGEWVMTRARAIADARRPAIAVGAFHLAISERIDGEIDELSEGAAKIALRRALLQVAHKLIDDDVAEIHAMIDDDIVLDVEFYDDGTFEIGRATLPDVEIAARLYDAARQVTDGLFDDVETES